MRLVALDWSNCLSLPTDSEKVKDPLRGLEAGGAYIGPPAPNTAGGVPTSAVVVMVISGELLFAASTSWSTPSTAASSRRVSEGDDLPCGVSAADMVGLVGGGKTQIQGLLGVAGRWVWLLIGACPERSCAVCVLLPLLYLLLSHGLPHVLPCRPRLSFHALHHGLHPGLGLSQGSHAARSVRPRPTRVCRPI